MENKILPKKFIKDCVLIALAHSLTDYDLECLKKQLNSEGFIDELREIDLNTKTQKQFNELATDLILRKIKGYSEKNKRLEEIGIL